MSKWLKLVQNKFQQVPKLVEKGNDVAKGLTNSASKIVGSGYNQVNSIMDTARSTTRVMKWSIFGNMKYEYY